MNTQTIHWWPYLWGGVKLLKTFGLLPGAIAAIGMRRFYQKWRQRSAMEGWPTVDGTVQSGKVHQEGTRNYWAEITYTYYVGEYRSGHYVRHFRKEEQADDFVRQLKDKHVQVRYDERKPDTSVLLERDLEMIVMLTPEMR
ncbi:MAG: DUF3592 domain-containing protein [Terracidiphilus sp.]|nr:DUF3592 domain-containing protein [Terracidiphilus sp.]